jgi:hypothetical protein
MRRGSKCPSMLMVTLQLSRGDEMMGDDSSLCGSIDVSSGVASKMGTSRLRLSPLLMTRVPQLPKSPPSLFSRKPCVDEGTMSLLTQALKVSSCQDLVPKDVFVGTTNGGTRDV